MLLTSLPPALREKDRDAMLGIATMYIGVGQGIATVFERV